MRFPLEFALACAAAVMFILAGRLFVQRPEQVYRAISFGKEPDRLGVRLLRGVGWFYIVAGSIAAVLFLVGTLFIWFHSH
ncbi:MAG: hypothetical protein ACRD3F_01685 [Acidobacteriaceae bacterium]